LWSNDAQFPPHEQVIPKEHKKVITVDRVRFIDALRRAQLMSSETRGVKVATTKDGVTITSDKAARWCSARARSS
jgi:DNA polymerase III sliding clamp (beta) subunit (PCNA family)